MESNLYNKTLSLYNEGEYEEVLKILLHSDTSLSEKENVLLRESKKQVTEQYLFLIRDYIQQKEYEKAKKLQEEYVAKYNFDDKVSGVVISGTTSVLGKDKLLTKNKELERNNVQSITSEAIQSNKVNQQVSKRKKRLINAGIILLTVICFNLYLIFELNIPIHHYIMNLIDSYQQEEVDIVPETNFNQFEYIKEIRGNYEVDVEWPLSLAGISDISGIQQAIIKKAFGKENSNIHDCVENYFKECQEEEVTFEDCEPEGKVQVNFQQKLNNLYVFKIYLHIDSGGGSGFGIEGIDAYVYYDNNTGSVLDIKDLFIDKSRTLMIINKHISLDEYAQKAEELPNNFCLSSSGVTFIFPKYSIGYGYQGNVEITLDYDELNSVLSDTFKRAIGR